MTRVNLPNKALAIFIVDMEDFELIKFYYSSIVDKRLHFD